MPNPRHGLNVRVGILGGGQLGKMLCQAGSRWDLPLSILDKSSSYPAGSVCPDFQEGDFASFQDVLQFGQSVDLLTVEIEHVNTDALRELIRQGKQVHPHPDALDIIKDKGKQKAFYQEHRLPAPQSRLYESAGRIREDLASGALSFPFVQKSRTAGYDGRGVAIIRNEAELSQIFDAPSVVEDYVDLAAELAVIVCRNSSGEMRSFPPVMVHYYEKANLVDYLVCPAPVDGQTAEAAVKLAEQVMQAFGISGLLAVELFLDRSGRLLINEVAPRPHNSGHHTIEANITSQFEQHLRGILDLPLGDPGRTCFSAMHNLVGFPGHSGPVRYAGLESLLRIPGVYIHLYGKKETRPFRKMGHVTICGTDPEMVAEKLDFVRKTIQVIT